MTRLIRALGDAGADRRGGAALSYPEVGATLRRPLPAGYHHLHRTTRIGQGRAVFERAGAALASWRLHRRSGMRVEADAPHAEPGGEVSVGRWAGRFGVEAPCTVVWTVADASRTGFAYGTRPGHPERGEESFVVELRADGSVWFTVTAFSRPACWYTRLAGPLVPVAQGAYARHLGRTLRRLAT
ncbi:DUF1990 family protein [Streptomyces sp. ODS05-4]|uniref:DUF1990 family protein n=1 Tax=Streptomyces sp. ODS05-4 TaxID=2944939 RepID=UPI00210C1672|nr:DUF1990 domain-containing protein [Streptomyces sp. ODS05-4]